LDRKIRHADQKSQFKIESIGLSRTGLQCRTAKTGLQGHDFRDRTATADFAMI
jgi:hypothetical protein